MGNALQQQINLEEAVKAYRKAILINPDYAEAYNNMGNVLGEQINLEEALKAYEKAYSSSLIMLKPGQTVQKHWKIGTNSNNLLSGWKELFKFLNQFRLI